MLKILQSRLQQYVNHELPDFRKLVLEKFKNQLKTHLKFQAGFRKGRGTRDQIANILWIIKKAKVFQKNIYLCFIDYTKAFVWITINCGKF